MKNTHKNRIALDEKFISEINGGSPTTGTDFFYDISYALAYGYATLISYIGAHAVNYGIAFK